MAYFVLVNLFANNSQIYPVDRIYTLIFMVTLAIPVYLNLSWSIPQLLRPAKYLHFSLAVIMALLLGIGFNLLLFNHLIDFLLPGYYFISYYTVWDLAKFFSAFLLASSLLKLSKEWFQLLEAKQELSELEKEKTAIELKALRSQINPHFLFNSLNLLYTMALNKASETPEVIIKLSDLLRYAIYEANKELVKLSLEVEQVHNYLDLQRHRMEEGSTISFEKQVEHDVLVPPMLLIPLIENSFKHGIKGNVADTFIHMELISKREKLLFTIENNKGETGDLGDKEDHGVGLENIKNRLKLLYPGKHKFLISENEHTFKVNLEIHYEDPLFASRG
ncbi:hypothetical protein GCM10028791_37240 [Echinicola sediminis]